MECNYTWKISPINWLMQAIIGTIEGTGRHPRMHRCMRRAGHADEPATAMHMCVCTTTYWEGWTR